MFEKIEILIIIFALLAVFYLVIAWGASKKGKSPPSIEVKRYLLGVRILIIFIAIVSLILWFLM